MRIGIIDLGTNTFHCLIAETQPDGSWQSLHRERRFVKLAEAGIERIGTAAYERGMEALERFGEVLAEYAVTQVKAFGTAALRTADNGPAFIEEARVKTGIFIELISGDREAEYIYRGVAQAVPLGSQRSLIMDIGGGSVEFIIVNEAGVFWRKSFPVGVAVLYKHFHRTDPISEDEVRQLLDFLQDHLAPLATALAEYPTHQLIGAAGTFDVLAHLLGRSELTPQATALSMAAFSDLYYEILASTSVQRHAHADIPDTRADMIVVALVLVRYVLDLAAIQEVVVSRYSMKEGMLAELTGV